MEYAEKFILASGSPRRKELFSYISEDFECVPAEVDETAEGITPLTNVPEELARRKAEHIAKLYPQAVVIGCDTAVFIDGVILGKPENKSEAFKMLRNLSGRTHSVITGCCVCKDGNKHSFSEKTEVEFFELSDEEIQCYIDTGEPFDKAGAYGIQGAGRMLVKRIKGDFYNVVGLPVAALARFTKKILADN